MARERLLHGTSRFGFFSETLVTGLVLFVLCLPLVTVLPALAAGAAHLRRHLEGRPDDLRGLWEDFVEALRGGGWLATVATAALLALLGFNIVLAGSGALPGGRVVTVVTVVLALALLTIALRAAGRWPALRSWREAIRRATRVALADPAGTLLVLSAVGLCGVIVWMLLPLLFLVPGLLALALLAVENRPQAARVG